MRTSKLLVTVLVAVAAGAVGLAQPASAAAWQPWEGLGGSPVGAIGKAGVATREGGIVDVFATSGVGGTTVVNHRTWSSGAGWSGWRLLPGPLGDGVYGTVSAVGRPGNRLSVVVADAGQIRHQAYDAGAWRGWQALDPPGFQGHPAVSSRPNGTVDVWVQAANRSVLHRAWTTTGGWGGWENLGGVVRGDPAAAGGGDGSVWLAAQGTDGNYYHRVWSPSGGWSTWYNTGTPPGGTMLEYSPGISVRPNGVVDLYAVAFPSGPLYHRFRSTAGVWSAWESLQGANIALGANATARSNGALDVVVRKNDGTVWHRAYA
jgi:hypothetical protein